MCLVDGSHPSDLGRNSQITLLGPILSGNASRIACISVLVPPHGYNQRSSIHQSFPSSAPSYSDENPRSLGVQIEIMFNSFHAASSCLPDALIFCFRLVPWVIYACFCPLTSQPTWSQMASSRRLLQAAAALSQCLTDRSVPHAFHGAITATVLGSGVDCEVCMSFINEIA
jgi:hypothetical protein